MKIAVITCHNDPDYVRARVLRAALRACTGVDVIVAKNHNRGVGRYFESLLQIIKLRITQHPDAYLLTFRGYEMLPFLGMLSWPKPLIYDEYLNPIEWLQEPREEAWAKKIPTGLLRFFYRPMLWRCKFILADTPEHAEYSARLSGVPLSKFRSLYVSTDESVFSPVKPPPHHSGQPFRVFFYGNMLPNHGLPYMLRAAELLKENDRIEFMFAGGKPRAQAAIKTAHERGARITYKKWVDFEKIPGLIAESGLCIAGPFGNTTQAQYVINGRAYQFMAMGVPMLIGANKASGKFTDCKNCLMAPQADAEALANKIAWAAYHPTELESIGRAGRELYEREFSNKVVAAKLQEIVDSIK